MSDFSFSGVYDLPTHRASAAFTSKTSEVFKEQHDIAPIGAKDSANERNESLLSNSRVQPILSNERMQYVPWVATT